MPPLWGNVPTVMNVKGIYRQSFGASALEWHSVTLVCNGRNKGRSGFIRRQHTVRQHTGDWSWRPYVLDAAAALGTENSSDRCWPRWRHRHYCCIRRLGSRCSPRYLGVTDNAGSGYRGYQCDWKAYFAPTAPFLFPVRTKSEHNEREPSAPLLGQASGCNERERDLSSIIGTDEQCASHIIQELGRKNGMSRASAGR